MATVLLTYMPLRIDLIVRNLAAELELLQHIVGLLLKHDSLHIRSCTLRIVLQSKPTFDEEWHMCTQSRIIKSVLLGFHDLTKFITRTSELVEVLFGATLLHNATSSAFDSFLIILLYLFEEGENASLDSLKLHLRL